MTHSIRAHLKAIMADRPYFLLLVAVVVVGLLLAMFVVLTVQPRDIQVITQYSAFGEVQFYKGRWYSLYTFAIFGLLISVVNGRLMVKLYQYNRRDLGILLGGISLLLCFVAARYAYEVMRLAFL